MAKVWLITGSSRGLGRAVAEAVLSAGDKLVATARTPAQLADLVDRFGDQVRTVALDVTDERAAVLLKGMSSEKHFSLPERQKYFPASSPLAIVPTLLL